MKGTKKIVSVVLTLAMVVSLITVTPSKADAAVKFRYGKKLNLLVGESDSIVVKGKATYKASNKKVATVSKKGVVKAKKPGICKITVKVGKSKAKSTVKVLPNDVKISGVTSASSTSAKVTWKKSPAVTGYVVYYSKTKNGTDKKLEVKGANKTSAIVSNLELGTTYYFMIKAYAKSGSKKFWSPEYSAVKSLKTWKMVWNDEFDGTKLDTSKWNNDGATGAGGYGNDELQNYQMEYSEVKDGTFIIKPRFKWDTSTNKCVPKEYYSTKVWTKGQYAPKYGKIEFRAKLPKGQGTWAAAWMLGVENTWPLCGEIDVLETTKDITKTFIPQSVHTKRNNGTNGKHITKSTKVDSATTAFHTYGVIWTDKNITFTIDGKETLTYNPNDFDFTGQALSQPDIWPFNKPCYLILNCAIGGTLGGSVGPQYWTKIATEGNIETYEDYYYIDWVRVSQ